MFQHVVMCMSDEDHASSRNLFIYKLEGECDGYRHKPHNFFKLGVTGHPKIFVPVCE